MKYEKIDYVPGKTRILYKLSEPFEYEDGYICNYVVEDFAWTVDRGPETMLFPADEDGNIIDFGELWCVYKMALGECIESWSNTMNTIKEDETYLKRCIKAIKNHFEEYGFELISKGYNGFWVIKKVNDDGDESFALVDVTIIKYDDVDEEYEHVEHHVNRKHFERTAFKFLMEYDGDIDISSPVTFDTLDLHVYKDRGWICYRVNAALEDDNE